MERGCWTDRRDASRYQDGLHYIFRFRYGLSHANIAGIGCRRITSRTFPRVFLNIRAVWCRIRLFLASFDRILHFPLIFDFRFQA